VVIQFSYKDGGGGVSRLTLDILPLGGKDAFFGFVIQGYSKGQIDMATCCVILIHCLIGRIFEVGCLGGQPSPLLYITQSSGHPTDLQVWVVSGRVEDILGEADGGC